MHVCQGLASLNGDSFAKIPSKLHSQVSTAFAKSPCSQEYTSVRRGRRFSGNNTNSRSYQQDEKQLQEERQDLRNGVSTTLHHDRDSLSRYQGQRNNSLGISRSSQHQRILPLSANLRQSHRINNSSRTPSRIGSGTLERLAAVGTAVGKNLIQTQATNKIGRHGIRFW